MVARTGHLERALRERGVRITPQRAVLLSLIESAGRPVDARSLLERVRRALPSVDKTTVYRTIALLKEHGLVDELDLLHRNGLAHYYEPVPEQQEVHLVCERCGAIIEARSPLLERLRRDMERAHGFRVKASRVEMGGHCRRCQ